MSEVNSISFRPARETPAVRRTVTFTFSDGQMMTLVYMRDATVNAYIAGVADKLWTYRRHCTKSIFPASGNMTFEDWCVIGVLFRHDLVGVVE